MTNKEKVIETSKRWRKSKAGRESLQATKQNRRAARGRSTPGQREARREMFGGLCWICKSPATELDHVIPIKLGGSNFSANLRPICKICNSHKGSKHPKDMDLLLKSNKL